MKNSESKFLCFPATSPLLGDLHYTEIDFITSYRVSDWRSNYKLTHEQAC